jgi:DNA-binding CsgD family transcriptional regulator
MPWCDGTCIAGPFLVYGIVIGQPATDLICTAGGNGLAAWACNGWPSVSGLRFSLQQVFDGMSLADKRALLEVILGASLTSMVEELESGRSAARPTPIPRRREPSQTTSPSATHLTRREWEVAELIAQGLSNREIAGALFICERTAEAHVTHVLNKLGLRSRAQIAIWVARHAELRGPAAPPPRIRVSSPERRAATCQTTSSRTV